MVDLSVVIPVRNEAASLRELYAQLSRELGVLGRTYELIIVDDGSTDESFEILAELHALDPVVRVIRFRRNFGQTAAFAAGFDKARGRYIVTMDGDLQNDPAEIPRLVDLLKDWDAVCGVRTRRQDNWWKRASSRIANNFRNWVTGDDIVDTGCTLKAFRRECLERLELHQGMHRFLPTLLRMRGYRVTQVPVGHHPRLRGKTKYGTWGRLKKGLADVWVVRWMKKNRIDFEADLELFDRTDAASTAGAGDRATEPAPR